MKLEKAIKCAIDNVLKEGLTDIFQRPFEVDLLKDKDFQIEVFESVKRSINGGGIQNLEINSIAHVLMPKNVAFDFRRCALIQPLDTIKYIALALLIADSIEKKRIPISKKRVYSYRLRINNGYIFNLNYNYTSFQNRMREKAKMKRAKYVISCDIANFYDRLNIHRLENQLLSLGCDSKYVVLLREVLLFWSNRDSYGLPVGSNASRILAEASLTGVDEFLTDNDIDFIRFVDDYRLFAPDANTAHYWLTLLIERLWREGLTINKSKTKIQNSISFQGTQDSKNEFIDSKKDDIISKKEKPAKIQAGYGGTVPTKFRELSLREIEKYKKININDKIDSIRGDGLIEPEQIVEIMKTVVSSSQYTVFCKSIDILDRFPQLIPYVVDVLIKYASCIGVNDKNEVKRYFKKIINSEKTVSEYIYLSIIRLFGTEEYSDVKTIMGLYRKLKRNSGAYIGRALLESLESHATRNEINEIKLSYDRSDMWEKRQIIKNVIKNLNSEEARPWLKNIQTLEKNDLFLIRYLEKSLNKDNKKSKKRKK